jgi:hypothetical protein
MPKTGLLGSLSQMLSGLGSAAEGIPHMSEAVMGFPSVNMGNDLPSQGGITGDLPQGGMPWQPKKPTILGAIADAYLMSRGMKPAFSDQRDVRNIHEAMGGMTNDPREAIRRLSQIPGHEADAMGYLDKQQDNERQRGNLDRQNKLYDLKLEEIVRDRIAGMAGAANADTWGAVRPRMEAYARSKGFDDIADSLPKDFNQVDVDTLRYGEMPVVKQEGFKRTDRRLDQADERIDETSRHNQVTESLTGERIDETGRHNQATEGQAAVNEGGRNARAATAEGGKNARHNTPRAGAAKPDTKPFMTKYGPMTRSKDGTRGFIMRDGKTYGYVRVGDKFVPVGVVSMKGAPK